MSFSAQQVHSPRVTKPDSPNRFPNPVKSAIVDICTTIRTSAGGGRCLGFLSDDGIGLHEIFALDTSTKSALAQKSLHQILEHPQQRIPGLGLTWKDSLTIAVTLASSIIQLDGTGWLRKNWSSEDIVFLPQDPQLEAVDYSHPYLSWDIPSDNDTSKAHVNHTHSYSAWQIRCDALASLGVSLIELCFGQSISQLRTPEDAAVTEALTNWNTAMRLLQYVDAQRGLRYGDVIRRCLECPFDVREKDLGNETFQRIIFESVVLPLREEFESFIGSMSIR